VSLEARGSNPPFTSLRQQHRPMNVLVQDDVVRAASFFVLAFAVSTIGGLLLGDVRLGIEWGFPLGVAFGVFAYVFIVPTADDGTGRDDSDG
jgi:hypothetical protein